MDDTMKRASEGWEPPFDEAAWEHMEQMLEADKDRKRPFAWWYWLVPILLVGGLLVVWMQNGPSGQDEKNTVATTQASNTNGENKQAQLQELETVPGPVQAKARTVIPMSSAGKVFASNKQRYNTSVTRPTADKNESAASTSLRQVDIKGGKITDAQEARLKTTIYKGELSVDSTASQPGEEGSVATTALHIQAPTDSMVLAPVVPKEEGNRAMPKRNSSTAAAVEKKTVSASKIYFSILGGIDGNGVKFPGANKFTARAGILVGYQISPKLSVQTGFFSGSKKYIAGKYDYKAANGSYWNTVDITKITADCRVFEIPLALRYEIGSRKKWNSFATAGLSSYIMDKEDYAYEYIRYGSPHFAKASYTGNQHFFSVLKLSAGMERNLSKQFSLGINPGVAIPLAGVGEGQIKLFSSEMLLSLKYRPLKKSAKATKK